MEYRKIVMMNLFAAQQWKIATGNLLYDSGNSNQGSVTT